MQQTVRLLNTEAIDDVIKTLKPSLTEKAKSTPRRKIAHIISLCTFCNGYTMRPQIKRFSPEVFTSLPCRTCCQRACLHLF